jgi:5-methylcytosine-specific restriction endonuclease McrA
MISDQVLLLNQSYEPLNVCTVRRAVVLLGKGKAELLENGRGEIKTPSAYVPIPSVIRMLYLIRRPVLPRRLSRKEVFLRDKYTCRYCGSETGHLTLDHVLPRHRGGTYSWENVVSACVSCNHRKAGGTPEEAGIKLIGEVRPPRANPYSMFSHKPIPDEWHRFIPWLDK